MNFLTFMLSLETLCEVLHMEHIRPDRAGTSHVLAQGMDS